MPQALRRLKIVQSRLIYAATAIVSAGLLSTILAATGDLPAAWHLLALSIAEVAAVTAVVVSCTLVCGAIVRAYSRSMAKQLDRIEQDQARRTERLVHDAVADAIDAYELHQTRAGMRRDG